MANFKSCSYDFWIKLITYVLKILKYFLEAEFKKVFKLRWLFKFALAIFDLREEKTTL